MAALPPVISTHSIPPDLATFLPNRNTPWLISSSLFENIQKQASTEPKPFIRQAVTCEDREYDFVMRYFHHTKPPGYGIRSITCIHNAVQTQLFEANLKSMEIVAKTFPPTWNKESLPAQRAETIQRWKNQVNQFSPIHLTASKRVDVCVSAKVVPLWHGSSHITSICESGFKFFGKHHFLDSSAKAGSHASTDIGYFGSGIYFTNSAAYAALYNSGELILSWVSMREPFPVVSDTLIPIKGSDMIMLEGRPAYQTYNCHYSPVTSIDPRDSENMVYHACHSTEIPAWDEYVVFEPSQALPRLVVSIGVEFTAPISARLLPMQTHIPGKKEPKYSSESSSSTSLTTPSTSKEDRMSLSSSSGIPAPNLPAPLASSSSSSSTAVIKQQPPYPLTPVTKEPNYSSESSSSTSLTTTSTSRNRMSLSSSSGIPAPNLPASLASSSSSSTVIIKPFPSSLLTPVTPEELNALYQKHCDEDRKKVNNNMCFTGSDFYGTPSYGTVEDETEKVAKEYFVKYLISARGGDVGAQWNVANCYFDGRGVSQNTVRAFEWYEVSARGGFEPAICEVIKCYFSGRGVSRDLSKALEWYEILDKGEFRDWSNLYFHSGVHKTHFFDDRKWFEIAAMNGNVHVQILLGSWAFLRDQDYREAIKWFRMAADKAAYAALELGVIYEKGVKNNREAAKWYRLAGENGYDKRIITSALKRVEDSCTIM